MAAPSPLMLRVKRLMDLAITIPVLTIAGPVLFLLAVLVRVRLGPPVFFRQQRPGFNCKPFTILKFRTMTSKKDLHGNLLPDEQRLTSLGRFLRRTSLDELPELLNVLKGDMSLVGPRPLIMKYLCHFRPREQIRHRVKPGISGWAQIQGRNLLPWDKRLALDVWYVENWSLWLDLKILVLTFWRVVIMEGAEPNVDVVETDLSQERAEEMYPKTP